MSFKPTTYLTSFAMFVILFMGTGVYLGWQKISDHLLAQAYLEAAPIQLHVGADGQGPLLQWDDRVPLAGGAFVRITAANRSQAITIQYSGAPAGQGNGLLLAAHERAEDLRVDRAGRYLYIRVLGTSAIKAKETTWLFKFDLQRRGLRRRTSVNPILLPPRFQP